MTITVPTDLILAAPVEALPHTGVFEPKWDGFRSWVTRSSGGPAQVLSRPVRLLRLREDVDSADVLAFGLGNRPAAG
jgi:hypothetical protein